jgi:hypothetical protein
MRETDAKPIKHVKVCDQLVLLSMRESLLSFSGSMSRHLSVRAMPCGGGFHTVTCGGFRNCLAMPNFPCSSVNGAFPT